MKSKWESVKEKLNLIEAWCRNGDTENTIAKKLGVSVATFENYKNEHLELVEVLKKGKEVIDIEVENALLKRALGYEYEETTVEESEKNGTTIKKTTKHIVPDTTAQIFWLKNRKKVEWRDKQEIEHTGKMEIQNNDMSKLSDEELRRIVDGEKTI